VNGAPDPGVPHRFAADFWRWRAAQQPRTADDIPRIERPAGWVPDWSPDAVSQMCRDLRAHEERHHAAADDSLHAHLLGSAIARVRWELEVLRPWQRNPGFYLDQTLGVVFDLLLRPPPFDKERVDTLRRQLAAIPGILADGKRNLAGHMIREFAEWTAGRVAAGAAALEAAMTALAPMLPPAARRAVAHAVPAAAQALAEFRPGLSATRPATAVGADALRFFLSRVALLPYTPDDLLALGRREFARTAALESMERHRARAAPLPPLPAGADEQAERHARAELGVRSFYTSRDLLSQPPSLRRYLTAPMPPYLAPLSWLGVTDDLTSATRLSEDAVSYLPPPGPDLPYFDLANAYDPRLGIAHEGAHYQQLALSWAHPDPARRRYYDSAPSEGIALYNEELLLTMGLYDDAPRSRVWVRNFLRLRALRVEVDVRLAIGDLDIGGAARLLAELTPMDRATAEHEAVFFAANPGQGLSYQAGAAQIHALVADAARRDGEHFNLRDFHDYLWANGNLPLSLLRRELLNDRTELDRALALAPAVA
jgi:hypothetical protein